MVLICILDVALFFPFFFPLLLLLYLFFPTLPLLVIASGCWYITVHTTTKQGTYQQNWTKEFRPRHEPYLWGLLIELLNHPHGCRTSIAIKAEKWWARSNRKVDWKNLKLTNSLINITKKTISREPRLEVTKCLALTKVCKPSRKGIDYC